MEIIECLLFGFLAPKYRRKAIYGSLRRGVGEILGKVCKMEEVTIIKSATIPDYVHMYVSIPPNVNFSKNNRKDQGKKCADDFRSPSRVSGKV